MGSTAARGGTAGHAGTTFAVSLGAAVVAVAIGLAGCVGAMGLGVRDAEAVSVGAPTPS